MFFCIGENGSVPHVVIGVGETIEKAISSWSTSRDIWEDAVKEFKWHCPVIIQGQILDIELECPPPIIKIL